MWNKEIDRISDTTKKSIQSSIEIFEANLAKEREFLRAFSYEFASREEIIEAIKKDRLGWIKEEIQRSKLNFGFDFMAIFDKNKNQKLFYSRSENELFLFNFEIKKMSTELGKTRTFFENLDNKIYEIYLLSIPDSPHDKENIGAYLVVAKEWNESYLKSMNVRSDGEIKLVQNSLKIEGDKKENILVIPLRSYFGRDVAYIQASFSNEILEMNKKVATNQILFFSIIAILFFIALVYGMIKMLVNPLKTISRALEKRSVDELKTLEKSSFEFFNIARMIEEFYDQAELLKQYKRALDLSAVVSKTDGTGKITYVNDKFCDISGYNREELIGNEHNIIRHPDNDISIYKNLWETIKSGKTWNGILKNRRKDGSHYYVKSTILPITNRAGVTVEFIAVRNDITDVIEQLHIIKQQTTDFLTNLPNRQQLNIDIQKAIYPKLALINIDRFRDINDAYGHEVGDKILSYFADTLKDILPKKISIYRLSGDEFGIKGDSDTPEFEFIELCEKILKRFDEREIGIDEFEFDISVRIGAAFGLKNLLINSEMAIAHAQDSKKNIVCFDKNIDYHEILKNNIMWTKKIKDAIKSDRFCIFAQEIVSNNGIKDKKYECLTRMIDEDGSIISPHLFIPHSKKARLYSKITQSLIRKSMDYFRDRDCEFSINMTYEDINNKETISMLIDYIERYKIGSKIIVEIVESESFENFRKVIEFINVLKILGCKIAIDDFGTGYSNFEYLVKFNVDFIKIDGSLIKNMDNDKNALITVKTIVNFAKELNMKTIAEFVHSKEIYEIVKDLGIDYSQGYYFHEPKSILESNFG